MNKEIENIIKKNLPEERDEYLNIGKSSMYMSIGFNQALSQIDTKLIADEVLKVVDCKEICICAAIQMKDGTIIRGHRHSDAMRTMEQIPKYKNEKTFQGTQGFITSRNRYVSRVEGAKLQKEAGIKSKMPESQEYLHGELYSEDLY